MRNAKLGLLSTAVFPVKSTRKRLPAPGPCEYHWSPPPATSCGPLIQLTPSVVYWKRRYFEAVLLQRTSNCTVMFMYPVVGVLNTMPAVRLF
jgi:hypothetical protein